MPHVLAAEGGYQAFSLHGGEWAILAFSGFTALVAIAVGFFLRSSVLAYDQGTPKMIEIATAIQEGALAYLKRQFRTIVVVMIPLALVVFITSVEVTNTMIASGMRMTATVRNCRLRYAWAPSWIAVAISIIFGVP